MNKKNIDPGFPLIDLHRHLDGSVRLQTILDLGLEHNLDLPAMDVESLRPHVQVMEPQPGVMAFLNKFKWMVEVLVDGEACRRIAYENIEDAASEGIDYIELRFSPAFMGGAHGLALENVIESVVDGVACGVRDLDIKANLIGILSRTYGLDDTRSELKALLSYREKITALDLAGDEASFPAEWFSDHFRKARDAGWHITAHAGESAGPQSIWNALELLGAERIGHGVSAVKDMRLMDHLRDHRIGIESSLTSNVQTSTVADYESHPIKQFIAHGILATINTDDPGISAIDLNYEYAFAAPAAGLTVAQIHQAQRNALETAFLSPTEKTDLITLKM